MDSFENIVAMLLDREGYWIRTTYKVELTKPEKQRIGKPSSPRWELDVIAYKPGTNTLLVVECKSYLNSPGVPYDGFSGESPSRAERYKLFTDKTLRSVVLSRLVKQLRKDDTCCKRPKVQLCLAAGNIVPKDHEKIRKHCKKHNWLLFDRQWFRAKFEELAKSRYENEVAIVAAKLMK
jgi:hypothetical protein